jgi:gluconate 2-dehydrogenase gamma chain
MKTKTAADSSNDGRGDGEASSRRSFLATSVAGGISAWLAVHGPAILAADAYAQQAGKQAAISGRPAKFAVFTDEQAAEIDAMASQIIPTDDTPGAHEARIVYFIDRGLVTFASSSRTVYMKGLDELKAKTMEMFPSFSKFSELGSAQQNQILTAIEATSFFKTVRDHTVIGMFASPQHGGNYNRAGWKLIGFEDQLNFTPPFGYYDAVAHAGKLNAE